MAVTTDEILAKGKGPMQTTWADQTTTPTTAPVQPAQPLTTPVAKDAPTGIENFSYDNVTAQGSPNNPQNAAEVVQRGVVNVANPQTPTDEEQTTSVSEQQKAPEKKKLSYVELFQQMSPYRPPTPEEVEKERKRQKREAIFAAIGEGISAMSNLYFTTQYAPNAFDPSQGMAANTKKRFDQLKKDREDNARQYMEGYMRAMRWDAEDERDERNWNHTIEREKIADDRYNARAEREREMDNLTRQLRNHQINEAEYDAKAAEIKAKYAEEMQELEKRRKEADIKGKEASARASNARAHYYSSGSGRKGPTLQLEDDEPLQFDDFRDYDRTVTRLAKDYGVPTKEVIVTERYQYGKDKGKPKTTKTVDRPVKDIAADIERKAAKNKKTQAAKGSAQMKEGTNKWANASKISY